MSTDSTVVGYLVGGIPLLIGGMGLIRAMEWFGLPPVVAGIGVVTAAVGVAETFGTIGRLVGRGGKQYADAAKDPLKKQRRNQSFVEALRLVIFLSGPVYYYALDLQFVPPEQWPMHLVTTDPFVLLLYMIGGPIITTVFIMGRVILAASLSERLATRRI